MNNLFSPGDSITAVKGIGESTRERLVKLEISTVGDLLKHYPSRYLDFTHQTKIRDVTVDQPVSLLANISKIKTFFSQNRKMITQATATDETGHLTLTWFNNPYIKRLIVDGELYSIAGKPTRFGTSLTMVAPTFEVGNSFSLNTQGLVPVYPQTAGITSRWLRKKAFELLNDTKISDPLGSELLQKHGLLPLLAAISQIHFPKTSDERWQADKRLSFNEHLRINITNTLERQKLGPSISLKADEQVDTRTKDLLPWKLTSGQTETVSRIYKDFRQKEFTHRLIQGETGSGKTATLIFAANQCLSAGFSCALLAPTEVLARQHFDTFSKYCLFPGQVAFIAASSKSSLSDKPTIYIGTHALFRYLKPDISPPLAFVAVDEQHKFGVAQRDLLLQRSPVPHLLNLSATPIPRTVALGLLGDINTSTIHHKPLNRLPVKTFILTPDKFKDSPGWLIKELSSGNRLFVVCPNIADHESGVSSVADMAKLYRHLIPTRFPLWSIHGKLTQEEQRNILTDFKNTPSGILVATSLIEVGIDIPEANIMIIHSAERFGLAQLHQLRGRVGRGVAQGYCFLVPSTEDGIEIERLQLLKKYHSGMILARKDLRLRGAGQVFGFKQHGTLPTRLKYFWSGKLFREAKKEARILVTQKPSLAALIATRLITW